MQDSHILLRASRLYNPTRILLLLLANARILFLADTCSSLEYSATYIHRQSSCRTSQVSTPNGPTVRTRYHIHVVNTQAMMLAQQSTSSNHRGLPRQCPAVCAVGRMPTSSFESNGCHGTSRLTGDMNRDIIPCVGPLRLPKKSKKRDLIGAHLVALKAR